VQLCDNSGKEIARNCQLQQRRAAAIQGRQSGEIPAILGYAGAETVVLK